MNQFLCYYPLYLIFRYLFKFYFIVFQLFLFYSLDSLIGEERMNQLREQHEKAMSVMYGKKLTPKPSPRHVSSANSHSQLNSPVRAHIKGGSPVHAQLVREAAASAHAQSPSNKRTESFANVTATDKDHLVKGLHKSAKRTSSGDSVLLKRGSDSSAKSQESRPRTSSDISLKTANSIESKTLKRKDLSVSC